jgi:hypothetical protein
VRIFFRLAVCAAAVTITLLHPLTAETIRSIDFFGIVSADADSNMVKMTEDLYYTQLGEIPGLSVTDKRASGFSKKYLSEGKPDFSAATSPLVFYVIIEKSSRDTGKWICILTIADSATGDTHSYSKEYDSYYKILMESKTSLQSAFEQLLMPQHTAVSPEDTENDLSQPLQNTGTSLSSVSTDTLAGTWSGEEYIDKIVILRGGRGFIIFKNGATMNISVTVNQTIKKVVITQSGKANASFFPDLPRKTALDAATTALPIQWNLSVENSNTLTGTKSTLVPAGEAAEEGTVQVTWTRK